MDTMLDIKVLLKPLKKLWPVVLVLALLLGGAAGAYGYKKAAAAAEREQEAHLAYEKAAPELPWYYTESHYNLRRNLSDNDAAYVEATVGIFRNYMLKYGVQNDLMNTSLAEVEDNGDLELYIPFVASIKDIKSAMSSAQLQYFNALAEIDLDIGDKAGTTGARITAYEAEPVSAFQGKWILAGLFFGAVLGTCATVVPVLFKKRVKNRT